MTWCGGTWNGLAVTEGPQGIASRVPTWTGPAGKSRLGEARIVASVLRMGGHCGARPNESGRFQSWQGSRGWAGPVASTLVGARRGSRGKASRRVAGRSKAWCGAERQPGNGSSRRAGLVSARSGWAVRSSRGWTGEAGLVMERQSRIGAAKTWPRLSWQRPVWLRTARQPGRGRASYGWSCRGGAVLVLRRRSRRGSAALGLVRCGVERQPGLGEARGGFAGHV